MGKKESWYLQAEHLEAEVDERRLFLLEKLEVHRGDRIGLIGVNGAGKTTLLDILCGARQAKGGMIRRNGSISYFRQFDSAADALERSGRLNKEFEVKGLEGRNAVSGGENTRMRLADVLTADADLMFFDEPTSNLDIKGIRLLKEKLKGVETFLLITHDRMLLKEFCNRILEIEAETVTLYEMGYQRYREVKAEENKRKKREYEEYIEERKRLESIYQAKKKRAHEVGKVPGKLNKREARLRNYLASRPYDCKQLAMEKQAKAALSRLEHMEEKEKPKEVPTIHMDFTLTNPPENRRIIRVEHLSVSYGKNSVLDQAAFMIKNRAKVAVIGLNGAGKTTLLTAIMERRDGVHIVPRARLGYFYQQFEQLDLAESVLFNVMRDSVQKEEVARNILARLLFPACFMKEKAGDLSGGERVKLAIAKLLVSDANVLLLDEPTNYLDMPSVEALTEVLKGYEGTILFASHDRALMDELATGILVIDHGNVTLFEGTFKEYESRKESKGKEEETRMRIEVLKMRLACLAGRISKEGSQEALEREYESLARELSLLQG